MLGEEGARRCSKPLSMRKWPSTFFVVYEGLTGLPRVVGNVWPQAIVQTCIIHLLRNIFRLASRKYWDEIKRDVKPIYTAVNATAARSAGRGSVVCLRGGRRREWPRCRLFERPGEGRPSREHVL